MVVDNVVAGCIRKEKFSVSELEDAIQSNSEKGSISLINSIAETYVANKINLEQAKSQIEEKNIWLDEHAPFFLKENRNILSKESHNNMPSHEMKCEFLSKLNEDRQIVIIDDDIPF